MSNRNTLWSSIFVDELARVGLEAVCIAPGSRSTPLTLAFAKHGGIKVYSHLDERSASFFALGLALATQKPVALVCTSGTAAANFFPAIVEAHQSRVPLLVITADRPPELRYSGANQTIDQVKMYGDYALWSVEVALPEAQPPALAIRNLRTLVARAYGKANGLRKGVVHLNMPFRKPLEPTPVAHDALDIPADALARDDHAPYTDVASGYPALSEREMAEVVRLIQEHKRGVIVCGPAAPRHADFPAQILDLALSTGYPVLADAVSEVRFTAQHGRYPDVVWAAAYDTFLMKAPDALKDVEVVLRFGDVPTSAWLDQYLGAIRPKHHLLIKADGEWSDDNHTLTMLLQTDEAHFINTLGLLLKGAGTSQTEHNSDPAWTHLFHTLNAATWEGITQEMAHGAYFDGAAVYDVVDLMPDDSALFVGNSLPVRHLDQFGKPADKCIHVFANRGASGIDGNISTALGAGAGRSGKPLVAIVGDVTFYHDMNGLLAVARCGVPVTIVLLNNNGGGIFHRLPVKDFDPEFTDLFLTPHGLEFEPAARMYGLQYVRADDRESFRQAFSASVENSLNGVSTVIEVRTDARQDLARRGAIVAEVQRRIESITR
ncbi:MAG: 2-succinyl-5-enolpyruvyl-6-hydroxy-3-cyclohexene-1-carboxylic-acid synthase [Anaerolineae bacterium]